MKALRDNLPDGLLEDVKDYLGITWSDVATDNNVRGHIASGMMYLDGKYGEPADYTADGMPRELLLNYCRYARDYALDVFENNFQALILGMQNDKKVQDYKAVNGYVEGSE